eukprot:667422-Prymnesium_polylepis.1
MANITKLHKLIEDEMSWFPYIKPVKDIRAEDIPSRADKSEAAYFRQIKNDTEYIESFLQKEDAAYV